MAKLNEVKGDSWGCEERDSFLPRISLHEADLPEAMDWEVGSKYLLTVEVELVELTQDNTFGKGDGGERKSVFKVTKVGQETDESYSDQAARMLK
jgi:hypothetical protein